MKVCNTCAKFGTPTPSQGPATPPMVKLSVTRPRPSPSPPVEDDLELKRDFRLVMRQAREKMGLSQEELGRKINEKPSVIRLLESGKLKPDDVLATKIAHFLKIETLVPRESDF